MKIHQRIKQTFTTLLILGTAALMFVVAGQGYKNSKVDLIKADAYEGIINARGIKEIPSDNGDSEVFYFSLKGLNQELGTYHISRDYSLLLQELNVGYKVKVYYKKSSSSGINLDVYQIEKGNIVILDKEQFEEQGRAVIYIGVIAGITILLIGLWQLIFRKPTTASTNHRPLVRT